MVENPSNILRQVPVPEVMVLDELLATGVDCERAGKSVLAVSHVKRFLDLIESGTKPKEAARRLNTTVTQIMSREDVRSAVKLLVEGYHLDGAVRKMLVRAGLNKIFIANVGKEDAESQKLALTAAKQIADDPEVGLGQQAMGVVVNMGDLTKLLANTKPLEGLAALEPPIEAEVVPPEQEKGDE